VPAKRIPLANGETALVATVFDLMVASYGVDNGLGCENSAKDYFDDKPYTPAWQEKHTGVKPELVIQVAREFAQNAHDTEGRSMVIVGAGLNHWYHMDMAYRGIINMLMMCGSIGKSGGGWCHYVGQEKLRPQSGWIPLTFATDWHRPPRQMNGTSFFYAHTSQWRHEKVGVDEILAPDADGNMSKLSMIDYNAKAERMGWLPSAPQLGENPLDIADQAAAAGIDAAQYVAGRLKDGSLDMACNDPDNPKNFPRNLFVWRSNLLGSSGKGHEYFLKYLLGTQNAVLSDENDEECIKPSEITIRPAAEGKLDLLTVLDFRMSTTCLYGDIVLPTATWYEKDDLNTSDMHPFIHPLSEAVQPL
jgi:respiratory nitrate reductase alpha chain